MERWFLERLRGLIQRTAKRYQSRLGKRWRIIVRHCAVGEPIDLRSATSVPAKLAVAIDVRCQSSKSQPCSERFFFGNVIHAFHRVVSNGNEIWKFNRNSIEGLGSNFFQKCVTKFEKLCREALFLFFDIVERCHVSRFSTVSKVTSRAFPEHEVCEF